MIWLVEVVSLLVASVACAGLESVLFIVVVLVRVTLPPHRVWVMSTAVMTLGWLVAQLTYSITDPADIDPWRMFNLGPLDGGSRIVFVISTVSALLASIVQITKGSYGNTGPVDQHQPLGIVRVTVFFVGASAACVLSPNVFRLPFAILILSFLFIWGTQMPRYRPMLEKGLSLLSYSDVSFIRLPLMVYSSAHVVTIAVLRVSLIADGLSPWVMQVLGVLPDRDDIWTLSSGLTAVAIGIELGLIVIFSTTTFRGKTKSVMERDRGLNTIAQEEPALPGPLAVPTRAKSAPVLTDPERDMPRQGLRRNSAELPSLSYAATSDVSEHNIIVVQDVKKESTSNVLLAAATVPPLPRATSAPAEKVVNQGSHPKPHLYIWPNRFVRLIRPIFHNLEISICCVMLSVIFVLDVQGFNFIIMSAVLLALLFGAEVFSELSSTVLLPLAVSTSFCAYIFLSIPWLLVLSDPVARDFKITGDPSTSASFQMALFLAPAVIIALYCRASAQRRSALRAPLSAGNILNAAALGDESFLEMALRRDRNLVLNAADSRGRTALHNAVLSSHFGSVRTILEKGGISLLEKVDGDRRTPIILSKNTRITNLLLRHGAASSVGSRVPALGKREPSGLRLGLTKAWETMADGWDEFNRVAKVVLLEYGAKLALLVVFFVGLSRIDLLHIAYVLMSLVYVSLPALSRKRQSWLPLAAFTVMGLICQYGVTVFQTGPVSSAVLVSLGFVRLDQPYFSSFFASMLAAGLCLFQLHLIDDFNTSDWLENAIASNSRNIQWVRSLSSIFGRIFLNFGVLILWVVFLIVSLLISPPTLFKDGYLVLCLASMFIVNVSSSRRLRSVFWSIGVPYTAFVVFLQYAVQYDVVHQLILRLLNWVFGTGASTDPVLDGIGLPRIDVTTQYLFVSLLPSLVVFFVTVSFFRIKYFGTYPAVQARSWKLFICRLGSRRLMACSNHISRITVLLPIFAFCMHPSAVSLSYVVCSGIFMLRPGGFSAAWLPEVVLVSVVVPVRYLFGVSAVAPGWFGPHIVWLGFRVDSSGNLLDAHSFEGEILILVFAYVQRYLQRMSSFASTLDLHVQEPGADMAAPAVVLEPSPTRESASSSHSEEKRESLVVRRVSHVKQVLLTYSISCWKRIESALCFVVDGAYPVNIDSEIAAFALLLSCALTRNIFAVLVSLIWAPIYEFSSQPAIRRSWPIMQIVVFTYVMWGCFVALGPDAWDVLGFPSIRLATDVQLWLSLLVSDPLSVGYFYIALWLMCWRRAPFIDRRVPNSERGSNPNVSIPLSAVVSPANVYELNDGLHNEPESWLLQVLPFAEPVLIIIVLLAACANADLIHLVLLITGFTLFAWPTRSPQVWMFLRCFNLVTFSLLLAFQYPATFGTSWFTSSAQCMSSSGISTDCVKDLGFQRFDTSLSASGFATFIVIFVVLDAKRRLDMPVPSLWLHEYRVRAAHSAQDRFAIAARAWEFKRVAELVSMRRVQEELRAHLRFLLTDSRRLGLEKLEDTEVWPSPTPQRSVHFIVNRDRKIVQWNVEVSLLTQWNSGNVVGRRVHEIFPRQHWPKIKSLVKNCLRSTSFLDSKNVESYKCTFEKNTGLQRKSSRD
ncbi:hypothetical protein PBRA_006922 [Plasmodiophora brassicae]|uniref:Uncharacterized protein n=1 Tax=Plasmodiophora brassicae TaxID=37360 RepID=A0A0G4IUJ9_PLABS|nr:hypothetical protein PBRA_006922 [Plasmodiophora brassicae]